MPRKVDPVVECIAAAIARCKHQRSWKLELQERAVFPEKLIAGIEEQSRRIARALRRAGHIKGGDRGE